MRNVAFFSIPCAQTLPACLSRSKTLAVSIPLPSIPCTSHAAPSLSKHPRIQAPGTSHGIPAAEKTNAHSSTQNLFLKNFDIFFHTLQLYSCSDISMETTVLRAETSYACLGYKSKKKKKNLSLPTSTRRRKEEMKNFHSLYVERRVRLTRPGGCRAGTGCARRRALRHTGTCACEDARAPLWRGPSELPACRGTTSRAFLSKRFRGL